MNIQQKIISNKLGLLNLAEELGNVSKACKTLGFSRDTFYRYREAVQTGGVEALTEKSRRKPNHKNRIDEDVEGKVVQMAIDNPAFGQKRASNELRKIGVFLSPAGVRCVWLRHDLETFQKRLILLEQKMAETNGIYTESQMAALEKKQLEKEAYGEIETEHPGYLGSQDTFFVGTLKGVGRIYQQTFVDTYSRVACAKLYNQKTPITAADLLNDRVLPLFEQYDVSLLRILTDRGTEYCGKVEQHDYQLFLAIHDVDHTKTKARHPQTNGICERFHKTILQEFYQIAFRKKVYGSIDELQKDLDFWIEEYNERRPHEGKRCNGRTPMETFIDGIKICKEKTIDQNLN
jgi:hypothetical protein